MERYHHLCDGRLGHAFGAKLHDVGTTLTKRRGHICWFSPAEVSCVDKSIKPAIRERFHDTRATANEQLTTDTT